MSDNGARPYYALRITTSTRTTMLEFQYSIPANIVRHFILRLICSDQGLPWVCWGLSTNNNKLKPWVFKSHRSNYLGGMLGIFSRQVLLASTVMNVSIRPLFSHLCLVNSEISLWKILFFLFTQTIPVGWQSNMLVYISLTMIIYLNS